jgi:hypothetical protein
MDLRQGATVFRVEDLEQDFDFRVGHQTVDHGAPPDWHSREAGPLILPSADVVARANSNRGGEQA